HVMASGALPPGLPMVTIGTDLYWDGGLVSNTPLQHVLDHVAGRDLRVFQVDLFSARGTVPRDMLGVLGRQKDIQYSSRTRLTTDRYRELRAWRLRVRELLARIPNGELTDEDRTQKAQLAQLPGVAILQLIYRQTASEGQAKDYDFGAASMRTHWESGYRDARQTLEHRDWLATPADGGIVVHDIHRPAN
ncbi:MAG: DUF3734 domain-containing protein, partial [Acidisphaera sp.]|nr:DUF3734 domain-containing protein [Acidisphaera sp.]